MSDTVQPEPDPKTILVTRYRHPTSEMCLILEGSKSETLAEALQYFTEEPEKLISSEAQMDEAEFRDLPEFEG